eukprot:scaffold2656_cov117-Amphora_coffeaeformis.AAC.2
MATPVFYQRGAAAAGSRPAQTKQDRTLFVVNRFVLIIPQHMAHQFSHGHNPPQPYSLDVEGAEGYIMEHFPFAQYTFKAWTIERPKAALCTLLYQHGYEMVGSSTFFFGETLWVHTSYKHELHLDKMKQFTNRKKPYLVPQCLAKDKE